jgi:hypothetical protein
MDGLIERAQNYSSQISLRFYTGRQFAWALRVKICNFLELLIFTDQYLEVSDNFRTRPCAPALRAATNKSLAFDESVDLQTK